MKKLVFGVVVVSVAFLMGRVSAQYVEPSCDGCQVTRISAAEIQEYVEVGRTQNRIDQQVRSVDVATMETRLSASVASPRFYALFVGAFAALALVLAAVGIYGILSYIVSQLRVEIGVRVALGAGRQDILTMVLPQGAWLTGLGLIIGLAGAFATTRLLTTLLFGVTATDPVAFVVVPLVLTTVALLACYVPARRVTRVDPMVALRYE